MTGLQDRARAAKQAADQIRDDEVAKSRDIDRKKIARMFTAKFCGGGEVPSEVYGTMRCISGTGPFTWEWRYDNLNFRAETKWRDTWQTHFYVARPTKLKERTLGSLFKKNEPKWVEVANIAALGHVISG